MVFLSWKFCLRAGVTIALVLLAVRFWDRLMAAAGVLISAFWPLALGAAIAYTANILMDFYERKTHLKPGIRRPLCMTLAFVTVGLAVYLLLVLIVPQLISCFQVLLSALPQAINAVYEWLNRHFDLAGALSEANVAFPVTAADWKTLMEKVGRPVLSGVTGVMNAAVNLTGAIAGGLVTFFLAMIFAIHILLGKEKLASQLSRLAGKLLGSRMKMASHAVKVADESFRSYIVGQCVEAVILGGLCAAGMLLLRLPYALMIGALVGVLALIPIAGAYIGAAVGAVMIFSVSPMQALVFLIFLLILQQVEGSLIYPHTVGSSLGLPGLWVLAAVAAGGSIAGIPGMIFAVPITAALYRLTREWVDDASPKPSEQKE